MVKKRRAPIEQLREAGRIARQMLIDKGIHGKESLIDKIVADSKAPLLPGIPNYLPHEWTLKASQQIMRDLVYIWVEKCGDDQEKKDNITDFWKFIVKELHALETQFAKEEKDMGRLIKTTKDVPLIKDIFAPTRMKENTHAMLQFIVDSFAVGIIVEKNHTTAEYLNWFLDWTEELHTYWVRPSKRPKK
jgi:hypothetical protein